MEDITDVKAFLLQIISERDQLRLELIHAKVVIKEFENQNIQLQHLLSNANAQVQVFMPKVIQVAPSKAFIGTWQCVSKESPALAPIERAWKNGRIQQALSQMPAMLNRDELGERHCINARLLYSAILQTGNKFRLALSNAEEALEMAYAVQSREQDSSGCEQTVLRSLIMKAQFHRGLCYYFQEEYANSRWCFILASNFDEHSVMAKQCRLKAEGLLEKLPAEDTRRSVSADFKFFCAPKMDGFVRSG